MSKRRAVARVPKLECKGWHEFGWLKSILLNLDGMVGHGRLEYWLGVEVDGKLPAEPIPQIHWRNAMETEVRAELRELSKAVAERGEYKGPPLSPKGAHQHIGQLIDKLGGGWDALTYLIRWLAWSLGVSAECSEEPHQPWGADAAWGDTLYREFHIQRLLAADADVLGYWLAERHGKGWNPAAFYPTPMNVCECMARMTMHDVGSTLPDGRDARLASVCDPCVGTGRMLLAASNFSLNLHGMDIDGLMVDACSVNLALFAPWAVYIGPRQREILSRGSGSDAEGEQRVEQMDALRAERGLPTLPKKIKRERPGYVVSRHGSGDVFSTKVIKRERPKG